MIWQDKGFLLLNNKYNENSSIAHFYTENNGKVVGTIFGASSKKIKNYLLIGPYILARIIIKKGTFYRVIGIHSQP